MTVAAVLAARLAGLLRGAVACALWLACPVAAAPASLAAATVSLPLAPHVEVLEDPGGALSLADVQRPDVVAAFRPSGLADRELNFGYSSSAYWLRFTLAPQPGAARDWMLELGYPALDRVEFFGPAGEHYLAGDVLPFAARPVPHRNFVFPLRIAADRPATVHLRVASDGTLTLPLRLWRADAFQIQSQDAYVAVTFYFGVLVALMLYNLMLFLSTRDRAYLTYVAFVACMAVGQLSHNGMGNQYLWPGWPAWGNVALPVGFAATGFFGALFTRSFLGTARAVPRLDRAIVALAALFAFCVAAPAFMAYRHAAILTSLTGVGFSLVAVVTGIVCLLRRQPGARFFLLAWSLLLVGVAVLGMRNLDWLPTTFFTLYAMQIGSTLEMLLLSFALADRINTLQREKAAAQSEALAAKQEAVDTLRRSEKELEARVADRTAELRAAEERYRLITDNAVDVIWMYDLAGERFVYVSPSIVQLRGYTVEETLRQGIDEALTPESAARVRGYLEQLMATGKLPADYWELEQPCKDGSLIRTETRASAACDAAGRPREIIGVTRDMTEKYKARQEQRQFVATMSHEFRTPLATIDTTAQVLAMSPEASGEMRARFAKIQRATGRLRLLLDEYLDEDRFESLREGLNPRRVPLAALLEDAADSSRMISERHELCVEDRGLPATFVCDPDHLRLALRILTDNAVKYAPAGSVVTLRGQPLADGGIEIAVEDQGPGIPVDELPHVFEKFFRGRAAARHPGTGLGLALARRLVELHGGSLSAESREGGGAVFRVRLPRREAPGSGT